jgi:putative redox protein
MKIELRRMDDAFNMEASDSEGHSVSMDAGENLGGKNRGVRPMQILLMGLGGCAAIDILLILKKQKQDVKDFRISIEGEREPGKEPSLWQTIDLIFHFTGGVEKEKAQRAVDLSMQKYCSVSATLEKAGAKISYQVRLNEA